MPAPIRAVFMGTPDIAVPSLDALVEVTRATGGDVVGVVCQPDRPSGRGLQVQAPPVKRRALELGLEVTQPTKVRDGALAQWIRDRDADVALVIAYGRILRMDVLTAPRRGCLNLHASLLPELRGAAPIAWAIARRHLETGVCLMQMDEGMDTGPVLSRATIGLDDRETTATLTVKLAALAATVTRARLIDAVEGKLEALPQDPTRATVAPMLSKGDAPIDLRAGAAAIDAHVRAMQPWPGATLTLPDGKILKVTRIAPIDAGTIPSGVDRAPGDVLIADKFGLVVACGPAAEESFAILDAQPEGKRVMSAGDLVNGRVVARGMKLTGRA